MSRATWPFFVWGVISACLGLGCGESGGPPLGFVTGNITMDGEPLAGVRVTFVPAEKKGAPSYGVTDANGDYRLFFSQRRNGAILGKHNVLVEVREPQLDDHGAPIDDLPFVKIHNKYQQPGALTADVNSGRNQCDFEVEPEPVTKKKQAGVMSVGTRTAGK